MCACMMPCGGLASYPVFLPHSHYSQDVHQSSRSNTVLTLKIKRLQINQWKGCYSAFHMAVPSILPTIMASCLSLSMVFLQLVWTHIWSLSALFIALCFGCVLSRVAFDKMICQTNKCKCQSLWPNKNKGLSNKALVYWVCAKHRKTSINLLFPEFSSKK